MKSRIFKLFIFVVLVLGLLAVTMKASAASTMQDGASIRTNGNQGLMFTATVETLEGVTEHGFYVAIGEHTVTTIQEAVKTEKSKVDGNVLKKVVVEGENTTFKVVVYNIDEVYYEQKITAVSYVVTSEGIEFASASVTRSIGQIARGLYNTNNDVNEFIANIAKKNAIKVEGTNKIRYYKSLSEVVFEDGDTINLPAGTYSSHLKITANNVTILGPNAGKNGVAADRLEEAYFDNQITVNADLENITFDGIAFKDEVILFGNTNGGISNLTIRNCYFDVTKWHDTYIGIIQFKAPSTNVNSNFEIYDNYIKGDGKNYGINLLNTDGITIENNKLECLYNAINLGDANDTFADNSEDVNIQNNEIVDFKQFAISVRYIAAPNYEIVNNLFDGNENSGDGSYAGIMQFFGDASTYKHNINICQNQFIDAFGWHMIRFRTATTNTSVTLEYNLFKSDKHYTGLTTLLVVQNSIAKENVIVGYNCYLVADGTTVSTLMTNNIGNVSKSGDDFETEVALDAAIEALQ